METILKDDLLGDGNVNNYFLCEKCVFSYILSSSQGLLSASEEANEEVYSQLTNDIEFQVTDSLPQH